MAQDICKSQLDTANDTVCYGCKALSHCVYGIFMACLKWATRSINCFYIVVNKTLTINNAIAGDLQ